MPARVTRARAKRPKENQVPGHLDDNRPKTKKSIRIPLADRTNSASDENSSSDDPKKAQLAMVATNKRPRRTQRISVRLLDHEVSTTPAKKLDVTPNKTNDKEAFASPFKTPKLEISPVEHRPRRMHRLPSKFNDHSLSPKYVPLQPNSASTPVNKASFKAVVNDVVIKPRSKRVASKEPTKKDINDLCTKNNLQDENVPVKRTRSTRNAEKPSNEKTSSASSKETIKPVEKSSLIVVTAKKLSDEKKSSSVSKESEPVEAASLNLAKKPIKMIPISKETEIRRLIINSDESHCKYSSRLFRKSVSPAKSSPKKIETPEVKEKLAVYDFTYDPSEEPKIPKKKIKKQAVRKKAAPRRVIIKDNYSKNVEKQLESLKGILSKKNTGNAIPTASDNKQAIVPSTSIDSNVKNVNSHQKSNPSQNEKMTTENNNNKINKIPTKKLTNIAIRVTEENPINDNNTNVSNEPPLSYSPVPNQSNTNNPIPSNPRDPLNLIEEFSFFDEVPMASSSMVSRRSVEASPWRVNCEVHNKWPVNVYVKNTMTPAYESSFVNVDVDSNTNKQEKSVLFKDAPESTMKQTSILEFIREKSLQKCKKFTTPTKNNSVFDGSHSSPEDNHNTSGKAKTPKKISKKSGTDEENKTPKKANHEIQGALASTPIKLFLTPEKQIKDKDNFENLGAEQFFGFDESEINDDQENVSPKKRVQRVLKSRGVLKKRTALSERNNKRPMRMTTVPTKKFAPHSDVVNKLYEEMKTTEEPLPVREEEAVRNVSDSSPEDSLDGNIEREDKNNKNDGDDSPVPLFEDIQIVHHSKPERKSYSKSRRVAFETAAAATVGDGEWSDSDADSSFSLPVVAKKKHKKREPTHKENKEAEEWAEKFNSMIEEADQFPLLIE